MSGKGGKHVTILVRLLPRLIVREISTEWLAGVQLAEAHATLRSQRGSGRNAGQTAVPPRPGTQENMLHMVSGSRFLVTQINCPFLYYCVE